LSLSIGSAAGAHRTLASYVPETRFGLWFLGTDTWTTHVLRRAISDLSMRIEDRRPSYPVVLDAGCGCGRSFPLLKRYFRPGRLIGVDVEPDVLAAARREAARRNIAVDVVRGSAAQLPVADRSVDLLFCHQTFHHLVDQKNAIAEFFRVLKPGGLLLFAESTRVYIESWLIRFLFSHPMEVQKTAEQYLAMIRDAGFELRPQAVSYPYLWWSRSDLGLGERLFGIKPPADREETLVNVVAVHR
jgi:ubiquinone/menaquinone biosynthesis C-methylase UbiE